MRRRRHRSSGRLCSAFPVPAPFPASRLLHISPSGTFTRSPAKRDKGIINIQLTFNRPRHRLGCSFSPGKRARTVSWFAIPDFRFRRGAKIGTRREADTYNAISRSQAPLKRPEVHGTHMTHAISPATPPARNARRPVAESPRISRKRDAAQYGGREGQHRPRSRATIIGPRGSPAARFDASENSPATREIRPRCVPILPSKMA